MTTHVHNHNIYLSTPALHYKHTRSVVIYTPYSLSIHLYVKTDMSCIPILSHHAKYMDKRLLLQLNGNRRVTGVLRGYDPFMNIVLDDAVEEVSATEKNHIGMVVIRGNSISIMEALERI